jgi:hypothetical protein
LGVVVCVSELMVYSTEDPSWHDSSTTGLEKHGTSAPTKGNCNEDEGTDDPVPGKKKKKKKKSKNGKNNLSESPNIEVPDLEREFLLLLLNFTFLFVACRVQTHRLLGGFTDFYLKTGQTLEPSIPVSELFPSGHFPIGEIQPHGVTKFPNLNSSYQRKTEEEKRADDRLLEVDLLENLRHAAEIHRQVRAYAQSFIQPGIDLADMCERLEECNRRLVKENGLQAGIGFPTGCSINHVAAHYTPNPGDRVTLQYGDVMKVDFGTQIDGEFHSLLAPPLALTPARSDH